MELRNDDALRAVDDERAVVGHQRNLAEEDFLLLDVADGFGLGLRVFVVNRQANFDLERHAVGHAALLALLLVVLVLESDGFAAVVAQRRAHGVERAAVVAQRLARCERVNLDERAATLTVGAQVAQTFKASALALPVADVELDKIEFGGLAEVGDREDRAEDGLQARRLALFRQQVHLEKTVVRVALNLYQVRDADSRLDLRKVVARGRLAHAAARTDGAHL